MDNDLTFITNDGDKTLKDRFSTLIKDTVYFDCLVGYFYTSGFYSLYKSLESTEKIRILIGINTDKKTYELIQNSKNEFSYYSHKETKDRFNNKIIQEMENSEDKYEVEEGIKKFIEWLRSGKLEIRVYPSEKIHAKLYVMTFKEDSMDTGRVITGSSNFTKAGLSDNLEFNVELKNAYDYKFSLDKFNELWEDSVEVSEEYVLTVNNKTWLNDSITPYELYLKFLYEYLKEKINIDQQELQRSLLPDNFKDLEYQRDAVIDAKMKLEEYGGVFLSDVVGLGKTYISAMLAQQLDGRTLVIAPPILLSEDNPGSWPNVFDDFGVKAVKFRSRGKLDKILDMGVERYRNIFIDESHDFRNEETQSYAKLAQICKGKRIILVSATPLNNGPKDILSQIKLFQKGRNSTLPHPEVRNLEKYFSKLQRRLNGLDRQKDKDQYLKIVEENANEIRQYVLQYLMVRRTRSSIVKYYGKDMAKQGLSFPEVEDPTAIFYQFDENLDKIFHRTLELLINNFTYSRYTPLLYLKRKLRAMEVTSQRNMGKFMKILLLKRLESSFFAFKQSIDRFIKSYIFFINEFKNGQVYVSKKHINKIFEYIENDDFESIQKLIDNDKASSYDSSSFESQFITDLKNDLDVLNEIKELWDDIYEDPKLDAFIELLKTDNNLRNNKLLIFSESKETVFYLRDKLHEEFGNVVLGFSGQSPESDRAKIIRNFDANHRNPEDKYSILISTDVLAQGVNLHRSNVVINYDIPWNPTRMMQRVGRIQRVDTKFDKVFTYNFFPAGQINENIGLEEAAEAKISAFIEMLGNDSKLLTDEEIKSHDLFARLNSKELLTGEDEEDDYELKYLKFLRDIRDNNKELFEKIKKLPRKARTSRKCNQEQDSLLTFFRSGKLRKIFLSGAEIDFLKAAKILEVDEYTKAEKIIPYFYELLEENKKAFDNVFDFEDDKTSKRMGRNQNKLIQIIKATLSTQKDFTEIEEDYLQDVLELLVDGVLPKPVINNLVKNLNSLDSVEPLAIYSKIRAGIPDEFLQNDIDEVIDGGKEPREVILSEYLVGGS
jgi:superfamily II DNA/RNA helicase